MKFKKILLNAILVVVAATWLISCSNSGEDPHQQNAAESSEDNNPGGNLPTKNSVLRIAVNTEIDSFDPYLSAAADTQAIMMNVFEGLTMTSPQGEIIPALAKDWDISPDGKEYTFYLEENVLFHNGELFSAGDVVFSLKRLSGLDGGKAANSKFEDLSAVEKIDDYTVKVTLNQSDASFLGKCMTAIVPEDYTEQASQPVGTGPYRFSAFQPGQLTRLARFSNYYNENRRGSIDTVEFILMPDDSAKIMALRSGDIDLFEAAGEIIAQIGDEFTKFHSYSNTAQVLALNHHVPPFDNADIRRAINYAVNRQEIIDIVSGGTGYPIYTLFTPSMEFWYNKDTENTYPYDPEKAKALLASAGYENGFDMEITVPSNYQIHVNTAQVIVSQLEKIGVSAVIKQVEWGQWTSEVYTDGNYHATITGLGGKIEPHDIIVRFESQYYRNFFHFKNDEYDTITAAGIGESDPASRRALYNSAQEIITNEAAAVFIQDPGRDMACSANVKGYTAYPIIYWDLVNLYFE